MKRRKAWRMRSALLILQALHRFTYVTAHSPTLPSLYLRHSSFSNSSVASPTSQLILQPFYRFSYVTGFSLTSPGEPPMVTGDSQNQHNCVKCSLPRFATVRCVRVCMNFIHAYKSLHPSPLLGQCLQTRRPGFDSRRDQEF